MERQKEKSKIHPEGEREANKDISYKENSFQHSSIFFSPIHNSFFGLLVENQVLIYEIVEISEIEIKQVYQDCEKNEIYRSGCFSCSEQGHPILAVGGNNQVIRVIDCYEKKLLTTLIGHGKPINSILFHPIMLNILFSSSFDLSIRMWNTLGHCIAVFGGFGGHSYREPEINLDVSINQIVSCGKGENSSCIKIWRINDVVIEKAMKDSQSISPESNFKPIPIPLSTFSASKLHENSFATSVKWIGDFLLSKSETNLMLWAPSLPERPKRNEESISVLCESSLKRICDTPINHELVVDFSQQYIFIPASNSVSVLKIDVEKMNFKQVYQLMVPSCYKLKKITLSFDCKHAIILTQNGILLDYLLNLS